MRRVKDWIRELRNVVGPAGIVDDPARLVTYESDALALVHVRPELVLLPQNTAEAAAAYGILSRAGGTDLVASSRQARWGRDDLRLEAAWKNKSLEARAEVHRLLGAASRRAAAEIGWRRAGLGLRLRAEAFAGDRGYYGRWRGNDRLLLVTEYRR